MMPKSTLIKENWRQNAKNTSTEYVSCDTLLTNVNTTNNRAPLLFNIRPVPNHVVDLRNIKILVKFQVRKKVDNAWEDIAVTDKVTLVNNFGFSLFEDVHLTVNGVLAETAQREYSRASYLKNLLFTSNYEMLESAMYYKDTPGQFLNVYVDAKANLGEYTRSISIQLGQVASFLAPVYLDILQADTFFPDHVGFTLKFFPAKSENCLVQTVDAAAQQLELMVTIKDAQLLVPRLQYGTSIPKSITTKYETLKTLTFTSPKTMPSFSRSLNVSSVPKKIAIALLAEEQISGSYKRHPFYFGHNDVKNVTVRCNGNIYPTPGGMNMDFNKKDWVEPYSALFSQLGAHSIPFTRNTYDNGYVVYGVNLSVEGKAPKFGTVDIDIEFSKAPDTNLIVLIFCFFESKFSIDTKGLIVTENPKV